jgi:hypothetical protein
MTKSAPAKPTAQAAIRRGPTWSPKRKWPHLIAKEETAKDQQDERLDEDDGQGVGDGHDLNARDEGESRDQEKQRAQGRVGKRPGRKAQGKAHGKHDGQHEGGLHHKAGGRDLSYRHAVFGGKLGRDIQKRRDHAEGEHQEDALKGGVLGHGDA